jgi:N-acetylglucosamine-6-phosphate deacetylase
MRQVLTNGRVLTDHGFEEGLAVVLDGATIEAVVPAAEAASAGPARDMEGAWLAPGFIDTQVNGGGGVLFNDCPTAECVRSIGEAHRRFGTTGFLPTLISDDLDVIATAIDAVEQALAEGAPGVLGIHIEGPFLNVDRKGVHDASKFRTLDEEAFTLLTRLQAGRTLVTLAPETTTPRMIRRLADAGLVVSAGHTDGDYETVRGALACGVTGFTHLFNAMSPLASRAPGAVGAALEDLNAWCGIIVDGRHVDPVVLKLAMRCRPLNRFMLVTDAMPSVGSAEKTFVLQGRRITVDDGVCVDPDGVLAGSDLDMASAVRNSRDQLGLDLAEACRMASRYPAEFLGLGGTHGRIAAGYRADLVLFDDEVRVQAVWTGGQPATH